MLTKTEKVTNSQANFKWSKNMKNLTMLKLVMLTMIATLSHFSFLEAAIPEYVGLYSIFRQNNDSSEIDPISMGQAILYNSSNRLYYKYTKNESTSFAENNYSWIEDICTFGHDENKAKKVINFLWLKKIKDKQGNFNINAHFQLSQNFPIKAMKPEDLGQIINYVRAFNKHKPDGSEKNSKEVEASRNTSIRNLRKKFRSGTSEAILNNLFIALEELKFDPNFYPETAEAILWALFEAKFDGQEEFKECLDQISPELKNNLNKLYDFKIVSEKYKGKEANKIADLIKAQANGEKIELERDEILYYFIKTIKPQFIPNIEWITLKHTNPKTNNECTSISCFESSMLEFISLLIYDQEKKEFNPNALLPKNITDQAQFQTNSREIFYYADKYEDEKDSRINPTKINDLIQKFASTVTNRPELIYTKKDSVDINFKFDLSANLNNFINILNKFFSLGLKVESTIKSLIVTDENDNNYKTEIEYSCNIISNKQSNTRQCEILLEKIAEKLSVEKKVVKFSKIEIDSNCKILITGSVRDAEFIIELGNGHGKFGITNKIINNFNVREKNPLKEIMPKDLEKHEEFFKNFAPIAIIIEGEMLKCLSNSKISNMINKIGNFKSMFLEDNIINKLYDESKKESNIMPFITNINNNINLKNLISNFLLNYQLNNNLFENLIRLHNQLKEANFITEAIYLYTKKMLTNKTEKHAAINNNFSEILSFTYNLTNEIDNKLNGDNSIQKLLIEDIKNYQEEKTDSNIVNFYIKNLTYDSEKKETYKQEIQQIISKNIKEYLSSNTYNKLESHCRDLTNTTNNKFMDDFLKTKFKEIIKSDKINLKTVLNNISSGQNEEALEMLPLEKLIENNNTPIINANNISILNKLLALNNALVNSRKRNFFEKIFKPKKDEDNNQDSLLLEIPTSDEINYEDNNNQDSLLLEILTSDQINMEKLDFLLSHKKININEKYKNGSTPLIEAISMLNKSDHSILYTNKIIIKLLSNDKIDINQCNNSGSTPLHNIIDQYYKFVSEAYNPTNCIKYGKAILDTIKLILEFNKLNLDTKDNDDLTAIELARELRERFTSDHNEDVNIEKIKMEMFDEVISLLEYKKIQKTTAEDNWLFLKP